MSNRSFILTFLVPTFALLFLFALYPLGTAIYYALHDWDMRVSEPMTFVGLQNFIDMFRDSRFLNSLKVSAQFLLLTVTGSLALAALVAPVVNEVARGWLDRKSTRLNSSHVAISYAVFCLKKKNQ